MRLCHELHQISITLFVFRKEYEPCRRIVYTMLFVSHGAGRDEKINADYRLDALLFAFFIKRDCSVEIAIVGERKRPRSVGGGRVNQCGNLRQGLKERVVGVCMKVD